ncbi:peptidoglycan DD-metalloendopeptidase family protein [Listeria welshimeri]|nr:peptidoglycan DD-metalloendopeptidase family protein [Listeria welshimeri]
MSDEVSKSRSDSGSEGESESGTGILANINMKNVEEAYKIMHEKYGFSSELIAGIMGNWAVESGINTLAVEGDYAEADGRSEKTARKYTDVASKGIGLGQWTATRHTALVNYAKEVEGDKYKWIQISTQMNFMFEADSGRPNLKTVAERSTSNVIENAILFHDEWERSADSAEKVREKRGNIANEIYKYMLENGMDGKADETKYRNIIGGTDNGKDSMTSPQSNDKKILSACTNKNKGDNETVCEATREVNKELWNKTYASSGKFKESSDYVLEVSKRNSIDPIVSTAIMFVQTSRGTTDDFKKKNNVARLSDGGQVRSYNNIEAGIDDFIKDLSNNMNKKDNKSLLKLASIYSQDNTLVGREKWVKSVQSIIDDDLGGVTFTCSSGSGKYIIPIDNPHVTSQFSDRINPVTGVAESHKGIDFGEPAGTPIKASDGGTIIFSGSGTSGSGYGGYGNVVHIAHESGEYTLYAHMQKTNVKEGDTVKQGDVIGFVGSTGQSTGNHLHFEIRKEMMGGQVDPAPILGL